MKTKTYYADVDGRYDLTLTGESEVQALRAKFKAVSHIGYDDEPFGEWHSVYECDGQTVHIIEK